MYINNPLHTYTESKRKATRDKVCVACRTAIVGQFDVWRVVSMYLKARI